MHEMHLLRRMFDDLQAAAARQKAVKVTRVYLRMGRFTEINEEILRYFFKEQGAGTILENAELRIEKSPARELRLISFDCE
jgi:Zn finger protein HypA/HybF involved in hydrogenase expression